jgi:hypothetical protein
MSIPLQLTLDARRTGVTLTVVMLLLVACQVLVMQANFNESPGIKARLGFEYWQIAIFDLDEEESFGTWFSALNLLFYYQADLDRGKSDDPMRYWW